MSSWTTLPLGGRTVNLDRKRVPVTGTDRRPGPFPYYGASGVVDYVDDYLFEGLHLLVAEDGENLRTRKTPVAFLADGRFWVNNHAHVVQANEHNDLRFLAYAVEAKDLSPFITGSTQPKLSQAALNEIPISAPPLDVQRAIASTLGALDDKIASNQRAISLAQDLSRATFVEWRAAQPTRRETTFGEFADVFGGATPRTAEPEFWNGDIAWATPTDITALRAPYLFGTARTITQAGLDSTSATLHPAGTILMTSRATIGSFAISEVPAAINQGFIAVRPRRPEHRWFLFEEMRARVPEMLDRANGSTFMELSRGNFKLMKLLVPNDAGLADLDAQLAPLHARSAQLDSESSQLAVLRDVLLPELLAGRIRISETSRAVDEVVV